MLFGFGKWKLIIKIVSFPEPIHKYISSIIDVIILFCFYNNNKKNKHKNMKNHPASLIKTLEPVQMEDQDHSKSKNLFETPKI